MPAPDPATIIHCEKCDKPKNGKGWYGAEYQCDRPPADAFKGAPSVGTRR